MHNAKKQLTFVLVIIIILASLGIFETSNILNDVINKNYFSEIITVGTVFSGFLFSVLGILLSLSNTKVFKRLNETPLVYNQCMYIVEDIIYFMISVISNLILLIFNICMPQKLICFISIIGVEGIILGVGYFLYIMYWMVLMIKKVLEVDIIKGQKIIDNYKNVK